MHTMTKPGYWTNESKTYQQVQGRGGGGGGGGRKRIRKVEKRLQQRRKIEKQGERVKNEKLLRTVVLV